MVIEAEQEYEEQGGVEEDLMEVKTKIQEDGRLDMMTHFREGTEVVVSVVKALRRSKMASGKGRKKLQKGTPEVEIIGSDEALAKGILSLKSSGRDVIKLLSDLNIYEIADLSIALSVSQKVNDILHELGLEETKKWTFLEELVFNYMKLKVSRKRMGRKEIANISSFNLWGQKQGKGGGGGGGIKGLIPGL